MEQQNDFFGDEAEVPPTFPPHQRVPPHQTAPPPQMKNVTDHPDLASRSSEELSNQDDEYNDGAQLAINGIPATMNRNVLYSLLSKYGKIQNLKMKKDHRYQGQNFAYATYRSRAEALQVVFLHFHFRNFHIYFHI